MSNHERDKSYLCAAALPRHANMASVSLCILDPVWRTQRLHQQLLWHIAQCKHVMCSRFRRTAGTCEFADSKRSREGFSLSCSIFQFTTSTMAVVSVLNLPAMPVLHLAVFVVPVLVVLWLIYPRRESREPPYLKPSIPIIGHVVGLLTYGIAYYERAAKNAPVQIFTLDLLVNRLYIVNSARLVPIIQRNRRIISFDPFLTAAANRLAGVTGKGLRLLQETRSGGGGLLDKLTHSMSPSLLGKGLDKTNRTMLTKLGLLMDDILSNMGECPDLHQWCRHVITVASTEAIWGAQNPFRDEQVVKDFW